jgi:hypothetical protein
VTPIEPRKDSSIIIGGARVSCALQVVLWGESGCLFKSAQMRRKQTRLVTLHWTGSENAPKDVHANMTSRGVSVHFVVDPQGVVWQMADADRFCAHAPGVNDRSIGIEIISRGSELELPHKGVVRTEVTEQIHGREVRYADFTSEQKLSAVVLVTALATTYHLPLQCPMDKRGEVISSVLSTPELARFKGVVGHLHSSRNRADPGLKLLRMFNQGADSNARA